MMIWQEQARHRFKPRLFTEEAWASFTPAQREIIRRQRMAVVDALALEHQRRYHSRAHLIALDDALHD